MSGGAGKRTHGDSARPSSGSAIQSATNGGESASGRSKTSAGRTTSGLSSGTGSACNRIASGCRASRITITVIRRIRTIAAISTTTSMITALSFCAEPSTTDTRKGYTRDKPIDKTVGALTIRVLTRTSMRRMGTTVTTLTSPNINSISAKVSVAATKTDITVATSTAVTRAVVTESST